MSGRSRHVLARSPDRVAKRSAGGRGLVFWGVSRFTNCRMQYRSVQGPMHHIWFINANILIYVLYRMHFSVDDLGLLIKKLRKTAGLSQTQLAQRHGMSRATISGIENNTIPEVGIRKVAAILEGLGYELTAIPRHRRKTLDELKSGGIHD